MKLKANAKVNLALDILYKRADGYHEVAMVMQSIDLHDTVTISSAEEITVICDCAELNGENNLAYRAAILLRDTFNITRGAKIELIKRIPIAAGLAGGSADAAAVLHGLNRLWGLNLSLSELAKLGAALGSDIPFCLYGGTMLATGRGEILKPLPALPSCPLVLVKPPVAVSTAWAYQNYRPSAVERRPNIDTMLACLRHADFAGVCGAVGNVLESVTISAYPEIGIIKQRLKQLGAPAVLMSGSGPTVFALCHDDRQAATIATAMAESELYQVIVTRTVEKGGGHCDATFIAN